MATITLTSITWSITPATYLKVSVAYRFTEDPDVAASYVISNGGAFVSTTGIFLIPQVIDGLDETRDYTVKVISICGGYVFERDFSSLTVPGFDLGFSTGFNS